MWMNLWRTCGIVLSKWKRGYWWEKWLEQSCRREARERSTRLWWRTITGRPEPEGCREKDVRSLLVLAPTHLRTRKGHREAESLSQGLQRWFWNLKLGWGSFHTPSCYTLLSPSVLNSRGIMKTSQAEAWQPQTDFVEQSSWQLRGAMIAEQWNQKAYHW